MERSTSISIIVPVYNAEKYLFQCIDSILSQTYSNFELILVDDGSSDNSGYICDEYSQKDSRIKVIHQENSGQAVARNNALKIASGKYITFVDADDCIVDINTYSFNISIMEYDCSIDMLVYPYIFPYECGKEEIQDVLPEGYYFDKERIISFFVSDIKPRINHAPWNKIYKREIFEKIKFPEGKIYEDTYIIPDILKNIDKLYCSKKGAYGYRVAQNSTMTSNETYKKCHDRILAYVQLLKASIDYPKLQKMNYRLYSNIFFYYLGLIARSDKEPYDLEIKESINFISTLSFPWKHVLFCSKFKFKKRFYLILVKSLGLEVFVKLYSKCKKI